MNGYAPMGINPQRSQIAALMAQPAPTAQPSMGMPMGAAQNGMSLSQPPVARATAAPPVTAPALPQRPVMRMPQSMMR